MAGLLIEARDAASAARQAGQTPLDSYSMWPDADPRFEHRPADIGIQSGPRLADHGYQNRRWGGWGSNPRPADYENYGPVHRAR